MDHVFASLAAGGPAKDVLLKTVGLQCLHRLGLGLWLSVWSDGQRGADGGGLRRQRRVGTDVGGQAG